MSTDFFPGIVEGIIDFTNGGGRNESAEPGFITIADVSLNPTAHISVSNTGYITVTYDATRADISLAGFKQGYITATDISLGVASVPSNEAAASKELQIIEQSTSPTVNINLENCQIVDNSIIASISSEHVGTGITRRTSNNLTASGSIVTAPSGYYADNATKAVGAGSVKVPDTTITANPSITVSANGLITATAETNQGVSPTISAGYVSNGTPGTITINGSTTSQLSTQASKTITPTENQQTAVAKGKWTTGSVLVAAISPTYVGSGVSRPERLRVDGPVVTAPSGYYPTELSATASGAVPYEQTIPTLKTLGTPTIYQTRGYVLQDNITVEQIPTFNGSIPSIYATTAQTIAVGSKYVTNNINVEALTATVTATCTNSAADWKTPTFEVVTVGTQSKFAINLIHDVNVQANASTNAGISSSVSTKFTGFTSPSDLVIESIRVKPAATYTPSSVAQTIYSKNDFINGNIVIAGDSNFISDNIAKGVTIWGVEGQHEGGGILPTALQATATVGTNTTTRTLSFSIASISSLNDIAALALTPVARGNDATTLAPSTAYVIGGFGTWNASSSSSIFTMYGIGSSTYFPKRVWMIDCIEGVSMNNGSINLSLYKTGTETMVSGLPAGAAFLTDTTYQLTVYKYGEIEAYTESEFDTDMGGNS